MTTKYALLVGVDLYIKNGSRKDSNGKLVSLPNLQGAVNDVRNIETILRDKFQFNDFTVFTSSLSSTNSHVPIEPEHQWPTHDNIKKAFDDIRDQAKSGDTFFFHFSGHGALLDTTASSPQDGRSKDPSLITADYCRGKPAVRGWELNEWLRQFNDKNVRVIVLLDSCYSGGSWRAGGRFRSPENWTPPPNLPADEEAAQGTQKKPGHRDGDLIVDWDINPKDFTLIAACRRTEKAAEKDEGGETNGAFTLALKSYLQGPSYLTTSPYHIIRDRTNDLLALWDLSQKAQVFGRDRLAFLEDYEPFLATPITGTLQKGVISLPVGKIHGINKGTEFITNSTKSEVVVSISELDDHMSRAEIMSGFNQDPSPFIELIPFRWSVRETLEVVIDPGLGQKFWDRLRSDLGERITGDIRYPSKSNLTSNDSPKEIWFRLARNEDDGIDIFGPKQLLGSQGLVRGWKAQGKTDEERARESAIALAHLFRFGQILHVRNESRNTAPFKVTINQADGTGAHKRQYEFQNLEKEDLYFAVLVLSSGFHVKQLFPSMDTLQTVPSSGCRSFKFRLTVPNELRSNDVQDEQHGYRDIIRTVVTRGKSNLSLRSMELPDVWNADRWDNKRSRGLGRNVEVEEEFSWWVQDDEQFTA